jgi:hypothetical protein
MSRFFAQLLLSIMIGLGAAAGFRSDVRGEVNKTAHEAKVSLNERANMAISPAGDVKTQVNTAVSASAKTKNARASDIGNAKADAKVKSNLDVQVSTGGMSSGGGSLLNNPLPVPNVSLDTSLNTNSQTSVGAALQGLELDLKNKTQSTLNLSLDLLK